MFHAKIFGPFGFQTLHFGAAIKIFMPAAEEPRQYARFDHPVDSRLFFRANDFIAGEQLRTNLIST